MKRWLLVLILAGIGSSHAQNRPPLYLQLSVDNTMPYVGQSVELTIQAFDNTNTSGLRITIPALDGFGQQSLGEPVAETQVLDAIPYITYTQRLRLYPNRSGTFIVEPAALIAPETPFAPQTVYRSNQIVVTVLPLPAAAPASFSDAIGQFQLNTSVNTLILDGDDALQVTMILEGSGNLSRLQPPLLAVDSSDWRALPPQQTMTGDDIQGQLTLVQTLLPQRNGIVPVDALEWSYFDPLERRYETLSSSAFAIQVAAAPATQPLSAPSTPEHVSALPVEKPLLGTTLAAAQTGWPAPVLWLITPCLWGICWVVSRLKLLSLPTRRRTKVPSIELRQQLMKAMTLPPAQAFTLIEATLQTAIQQRANSEQQTVEDWLAALPVQTATRLAYVQRTVASARFAPATSEDVRAFAQQSYALIRYIDRQTEDT